MGDKWVWPKTEMELADAVIAWLQVDGWEVWTEVQFSSGGPIADIIAVRGPLVWVIECKKSLGFTVLSQAWEWRSLANMVSVAVPKVQDEKQWRFGIMAMESFGVGLLVANRGEWSDAATIIQRVDAGLRRDRWLSRLGSQELKEYLQRVPQTFARAGNSDGKRWTPAKMAARDLAVYVRDNPGTTFSSAVREITTAYSSIHSAASALRDRVKSGGVPGVRFGHDEGKPFCLFPVDCGGALDRPKAEDW